MRIRKKMMMMMMMMASAYDRDESRGNKIFQRHKSI